MQEIDPVVVEHERRVGGLRLSEGAFLEEPVVEGGGEQRDERGDQAYDGRGLDQPRTLRRPPVTLFGRGHTSEDVSFAGVLRKDSSPELTAPRA